jgi:hypothetical protein
MTKKLLIFLIVSVCLSFVPKGDQTAPEFIERQGKITFFSYTPVENIQATSNQALSIFNADSKQVVLEILMRTFTFKKSLMYEHFNESYIESDLYPKALLNATVVDFDPGLESQTRIIKGNFTLRDITKPIEFKTKITKANGGYQFEGELEVKIDDHEIKVPKVLSANIAKTIQVSFNFQFEPYEQ